MFDLMPAGAQHINTNGYQDMRWRQVGPYRAGWGTVARGIPDQPNTYYFGGAGGGVWKTTDAGRTWQGLMQHENSAAVGALEIAPSNPRTIYVGSGQVTYRYDCLDGDGVYKSTDGGQTWANIGLTDTRHIGDIYIDPRNENHVLVAALGHIFGPNKDRGVFQTRDGGKTWTKTLFVNDETGAIDLASDPDNPSVIYVGIWKLRMHPWLDYYLPQRSANGSGIYKSINGGDTWEKLSGPDLPSGNLGRIGLACAQGFGGRLVYATIDAENGQQGLYRSEDGGQSWKHMNSDGVLAGTYFSRFVVDPRDANVLYFTGQSIRKSIDGGKTYFVFKGSPGGDDYHDIWINPKNPKYMITGSDQGTVVSVNGGKSWSSWYNQPTGQFYHLAADDQFPYRIYSGQQDNGTVSILSRGPYGVIEERDWHPVGGDERDYQVPKPGDPNIVIGTGLGGHITRFNNSTRQSAEVSPWPVSSYGALQTTVKYRYTWITPLAFSHLGNHAMYFGAQVLFKSEDDGDHWEIISPDLSGKKADSDGCNQELQKAMDCGYGVIYTIAPSPVQENTLWVGTDDGMVQITHDGGGKWQNISPPQVPLWGRVDAIDPSAINKEEAYVAINVHRLDEKYPLLLKTMDGGKSWSKIVNGLPKSEYTSVVRADPEKRGLLYAGTNRSVYISFDDGDNWQPITLNFPTTLVRDLLVHQGDLIVATQGRGIWVMDNLSVLRQLNPTVLSKKSYLFSPALAYRLRGNENHDTPPPPETPLGENPPSGAMIDYWLGESPTTPIELKIFDVQNNLVRKFSSDDEQEQLRAYRYFDKRWVSQHQVLSSEKGMHRFIWDLRYDRPKSPGYSYSIAAVWDRGGAILPQGPLVLPGKYKVELTVNGRASTQYLTVELDPRINVATHDLEAQLQLTVQIQKTLEHALSEKEEIEKSLKSIMDKEKRVKAEQVHKGVQDVARIMAGLITKVQSADTAPTQGQRDLFEAYRLKFQKLTSQWSHAFE